VTGKKQPFRLRFRVPLSLVPLVVGVAVAVPLWGEHADIEFFSAATHVLAIGAVGMALSGRFFRLATHVDEGPAGLYVLLNVLGVLAGTGVGLFFSFHALANGHSQTPDLAMTAGSLASGIVAFGIQAMFGTPGMHEEAEEEQGESPF
jgi:hypothetical protein